MFSLGLKNMSRVTLHGQCLVQPPTRGVIPQGHCSKAPQAGSLKKQEFILSLLWQEVRNGSVSRLGSFWRLPGRLFCASPLAAGGSPDRWCTVACGYILPVSALVAAGFSPVCACPFLIRTPGVGQRAPISVFSMTSC